MPVQHDPTGAVNLFNRERAGEVIRVDPHPCGRSCSGRHALCGAIQRTQDLAHVPSWIFHCRLDGFESVALAARVTVGVHDKKRHRYSHGFRLKQWKDLVLRIEIAGEAKYRDFLLRGSYPLNEISVGLGAGARPEIRNPCPREMADLSVAEIHPEAEPIGACRIEATQVLDPFIARSALSMLPTAQLGAGDARSGQAVTLVKGVET